MSLIFKTVSDDAMRYGMAMAYGMAALCMRQILILISHLMILNSAVNSSLFIQLMMFVNGSVRQAKHMVRLSRIVWNQFGLTCKFLAVPSTLIAFNLRNRSGFAAGPKRNFERVRCRFRLCQHRLHFSSSFCTACGVLLHLLRI